MVVAILGLGAYWLGIGPLAPPPPLPPPEEEVETGLTLRNVTLEQPDENGVLLWRVKAEEATYSPDRSVATFTRPDGELFQDGEVIYNVTADSGEMRDNGNTIVLRGNIVARGVQNGAILRGQEMEWRPQEDILVLRQDVTGSHPQLRATADEFRVFNRENRMELQGDVVANTVVEDPSTEPWLKLQAQELAWDWDQEQIDSPEALRVEQFKDTTITEVVQGQRGQVDLADQVATLQGAVTMQFLTLPLSVRSEALEWRVKEEQINLNQPLTVVRPTENLVVTARQGTMNLADEVITVSQEVVAVRQDPQSRLTTDRLTWTIPSQTLLAEGQVNYQQTNPALNLNGSRGIGRLQEGIFTVDGGANNDGQVVTEIVPN
ncbi:LPS export ABC transporter periplasmic protein LptC [Leptolyngbya sp. BL0902]|uniref:LPS export ABC transporter periplasmic protein LptC n=1 Tax=Leptolyngbya sp. BL0902 TaxID=1115757 RepID=UPI0018E76521